MGRLKVGALLGSTFGTVFRHFPLYLGTQGVLLLAASLLALAFAAAGALGASFVLEAVAEAPFPLGEGLLVVAAAVYVVFDAAALGVGVHVADAALDGRRIGLSRAWALTRPRLGNLVGTLLLVALVVLAMGASLLLLFLVLLFMPPLGVALLFVGFVVFYVALIWLVLRWLLAVPISLLERHPVTKNLRASTQLTKGSRGAILGALLLMLVLFIVVSLAAMVPLGQALPSGVVEAPEDATRAVLQPMLAMAAVGVVVSLPAWFVGTTFLVVAYRRLKPRAPVEFQVVGGSDAPEPSPA